MSSHDRALLVIYADESRQLDAVQLAGHIGSEPHIVEGILKAKDELGLQQAAARYIVIDIGGRSQDVLEELDILAQACDPNARVVVAGAINDISFYRALIARGIAEYYPYPCDVAQMANTLLTAAQRQPAMAMTKDKPGFSVGFMSAASGDGASTLALNTAYLLANKFGHSVVLVDLDYQFGMVARHLDLKAPYGIRELLEHPERGVDAALINKMMVPYGKNLQIIAAPAELRKLPNVRSEQIVELLDVLKAQFDFVLFDIQHVWVDWIASLISKLDHKVVASQLWLRSLTHVTRIMACWADLGIRSQDVSLVMNRSGSRFKEAMSVEDFQRVSGLDIRFYLPNDTRAMVESENQGKPVVELGGSELELAMKHIAGYLHSAYTGEPYEASNQMKKKRFFGMLD